LTQTFGFQPEIEGDAGSGVAGPRLRGVAAALRATMDVYLDPRVRTAAEYGMSGTYVDGIGRIIANIGAAARAAAGTWCARMPGRSTRSWERVLRCSSVSPRASASPEADIPTVRRGGLPCCRKQILDDDPRVASGRVHRATSTARMTCAPGTRSVTLRRLPHRAVDHLPLHRRTECMDMWSCRHSLAPPIWCVAGGSSHALRRCRAIRDGQFLEASGL